MDQVKMPLPGLNGSKDARVLLARDLAKQPPRGPFARELRNLTGGNYPENHWVFESLRQCVYISLPEIDGPSRRKIFYRGKTRGHFWSHIAFHVFSHNKLCIKAFKNILNVSIGYFQFFTGNMVAENSNVFQNYDKFQIFNRFLKDSHQFRFPISGPSKG